MVLGIGSAVQGMLAERAAKQNRDWQERMSNTAYQRGIKDLKKAGLNPILAAKFGGATTPSGSAANIAGGGDFGVGEITSAMQGMQQRKVMKQQVNTGKAQEGMFNAQADAASVVAEGDRYGLPKKAVLGEHYGTPEGKAHAITGEGKGIIGTGVSGAAAISGAIRNWFEGQSPSSAKEGMRDVKPGRNYGPPRRRGQRMPWHRD